MILEMLHQGRLDGGILRLAVPIVLQYQLDSQKKRSLCVRVLELNSRIYRDVDQSQVILSYLITTNILLEKIGNAPCNWYNLWSNRQ